METVRVFISSPGDVAEERFVARGVLQRLQNEFSGRLELATVFWEYEPLLASGGYQAQIPSSTDSDIFVTILWSRLGSPLPAEFVRPDGSPYASGTEYEFEAAMAAHGRTGKPQILVYRKTTIPTASLDDENALLEQLAQKRALERFVTRWFADGHGPGAHAYHTFAGLDHFEELLEVHLRALLMRQIEQTSGAQPPLAVTWRHGSPFRGLQAFEPEHAPVFFGRTRASAEILEALRHQARSGCAFLLILGMSGVGKSSLVRAGLLPLLTRGGVVDGVSRWAVGIFSPADAPGDPIAALAHALVQPDALPRLLEAMDEAELRSLLADQPDSVVPLLRQALGDRAARLVLVVDQLEELFTHSREGASTQDTLIHLLAVLAGSGVVWVVATLRSDFYPHCEAHTELMTLKDGRGQYHLAPPTPNEVAQMIRLPAQAAGLAFEENPQTGERLDEVLRDQASANPDMLPLLEFTLEELYQRRTPAGLLSFAAYEEIGGVEGSIARRAEHVYAELPPPVQAELGSVLDRLATRRIGDRGNTSLRAHVDELTPGARTLIDAFVTARLFVTELDDDDRVVARVAHEALLERWPRVQRWLADNEEDLRLHARLRDAEQRWRADPSVELLLPEGKPLEEAHLLVSHGVALTPMEQDFVMRSEQRVQRNHRMRSILVTTLVLLTVAAGIGAGVALQQRRLAQVEADTATATTNFLIRLFQVSDPWTTAGAPGSEITAREVLDRGAGQAIRELDGQPRVQANLMQAIGSVYEGLGVSEQAQDMLEQALATRRKLLGEAHPDVAQTLTSLALVETGDGEFAQAEQRLRAAERIWREQQGDDSLGRANALNLLSIVLADQDRYDEALDTQQEALRIFELHSDTSTLDLANGYNNLGYVLMNADRYQPALDALERAANLSEETGAIGLHARAVANMAAAHQVMGHLEEARRLHEEALALKREWFPPGHTEIGYSLNNLAWVVRAQGDYDRAIELYEGALANFSNALGDNHLNVSVVRGNLASTYLDAGHPDRALEVYRQSLAEISDTAGPRNSHVLPVYVGIGRCYEALGHPELALESYRTAVEIGDEINPQGWDVGMALGLMAALPDVPLTDAERSAAFDRSLNILAGTSGMRTSARARMMVRYARHLQTSGEIGAGRSMFEEALSIERESLPPDHPRLAEHQREYEERFGPESP